MGVNDVLQIFLQGNQMFNYCVDFFFFMWKIMTTFARK